MIITDKFWERLSHVLGLLAIGVVFGVTTFLASLEVKDLDLWLHLKMGKVISENLSVPDRDILSCSIAGRPWINHEWLFQVIVYQVWQQWDFNGLINMQIGIVFLTFLILLLLGYSKDRQFFTAFALLGVAFIYQSRFTIRPDIFSLLFFVSFIWVLSWFIHRKWSIWVLVAIQVLWTNIHGFFFFGPLLIILALGCEFLKRHAPLPWQWNEVARLTDAEYGRLKKTLPLILLACCINPLTFQGAWYPISVLLHLGSGESNVFFEHITELQKPITSATIWTAHNGFYKATIIISAMSLYLNRRKIDISSLFIWGLFLMFSLVAIRNMVFFSAAAFIVFMANVRSIQWENVIPARFTYEKFKFITGIFIKGLLIFWMIDTSTKIATNGYFDFDTFERKSEFGDVSKRVYPYHAVDFLVKNKIKGNFFNDFNSGAYLIGRVFPNIRVYLDGRTEVYGSKFFERYQKIWKEGDVKVFLEDAQRYQITGAFLNNNNQDIPPKVLKMFYKLEEWKIVYFDYDAVIFLKNTPQNKPLIDRFGIDFKKWQPPAFDLQAVATKRMVPIPLVNRAYLLKTLGLYDLALKQSKEAIKVMPDNSFAYQIMGEIYKIKQDYRRSFESFRLAVVLNPQDIKLRMELAESYEYLKDYSGARLQYERILEIRPDHAKAFLGLARIAAMTYQDKKALELLEKAQKLGVKDKIDVAKIRDIIDKNKKSKNEGLGVK